MCGKCRSLSAVDEQEEAEQAQLLRLYAIRQQLRRTQAATHSTCSCSRCCAPVQCSCSLHSSAWQHCASCASAAGGETVTERPQLAVKLIAHLQVRNSWLCCTAKYKLIPLLRHTADMNMQIQACMALWLGGSSRTQLQSRPKPSATCARIQDQDW